MHSPHEDYPIAEAQVNLDEFSAAIANLPQQTAESFDRYAIGEVSMPLDVDGETVEMHPSHLELVPDLENPGRFTAFMRRHKKEAVLLGTVTAAAVLAGVAAAGYKIKRK